MVGRGVRFRHAQKKRARCCYIWVLVSLSNSNRKILCETNLAAKSAISPTVGFPLGPPGLALELGAGVLGQIKYHALPADFGSTELHRGTVSGPALCRAVLRAQDNQHRKTGASIKRPGLHLAVSARCRLVLVGRVPRGQVPLHVVSRGVLRALHARGSKWAQTIAGPPRFPLHPV